MGGWMKRRGGAVLLAAPFLMLLTAAKTSMVPLPETVIDAADGLGLNTSFRAHVGDVLMRGRVLITDRVAIRKPLTVTIARFSDDLAAGDKLTTIVADDKTRRLLGTNGRIYCGEDQRSRSKFGELMIGNWFSKFEPVVRFCFVDDDSDGVLDHMFLGGAKDKEYLGLRPIDPTPIVHEQLVRTDDAAEVRLVFKRLDADSGKLELELQLWRGGQRVLFDYLLSSDLRSPAETEWPLLKHNPKKMPYPVRFRNVLRGDIGINSVDPASQTAEFVISRPFGPVLFKPVVIQTQTIYVYVYTGG